MSHPIPQPDAQTAWSKVRIRPLEAHERSNQGGPDIVRLVEPIAEGSAELLAALLREDLGQVESLMADHGAVLFRGCHLHEWRGLRLRRTLARATLALQSGTTRWRETIFHARARSPMAPLPDDLSRSPAADAASSDGRSDQLIRGLIRLVVRR